MSLKFANRVPRQWSLTTWLAVWYTALACLLIGATTLYSYYILITQLDLEDQVFIATRLTDVENRLASNLNGLKELQASWAASSENKSELRIVIRVLAEDGSVASSVEDDSNIPWPIFSFRGVQESTGWQFMAREVTCHSGMKSVVQAALDRRRESIFLSRYRKQLYLMLLIATLASVAGGVAIVRRGLQPLLELSELASSIGANHMEQRLDTSQYAVELKRVATTFNGMLDRLKSSFEQINRFSGDIAHELRTPLHNLRGEMEVTLTKNRNDAEYKDVLGSCLEETIRLSRLVDSLLFLARGDQPKSFLKKEEIPVREELVKIQEFFDAAADDRGISLSVSSPELTLHADRTLFQRVIGNLITNAIPHTPQGGRIEVCAKADSNFIRIVVKDNGSGITAKDLPFVFDRLYTGSGARSGPIGCGLGLSIVKAIVELHGGSVGIISDERNGTLVETSWPIQP